MATTMDAIAEVIRETIQQGIMQSLPEQDPVFEEFRTTSVGVERSGIGRDWKVKNMFCGSIAGTHWWRSAAGGTVLADGSPGVSGFTAYDSSTLQAFPGFDEMTAPGFIQKEIQLYEGTGGFPVPLTIFRADLLDAAVGQVVEETVKGAATRQAMSQAHAWWKLNSYGSVVQIVAPASSEDIDTTGQYYTVTGGRIRQVYPGMIFQVASPLVTPADSGLLSTVKVYVDHVDYLQKKIFLKTLASSVNLVASSTYQLVPYNPGNATGNNGIVGASATRTGPSGLVDTIKSSGTVFGISLTTSPQFRSLLTDAGNVALGSTILNRHVAGIIDAGTIEIDTVLMTEGILVGLLENIEDASQLVRYDVQGSALNVQQGFDKVGYRYNGKVIKLRTSALCHDQTAWGLKLGGQNWKRYVPPKLKGTSTNPGFDGEVEFIGPLYGAPSIFLPVHNSSANYTDMMVAPYLNWMEFCPKQIPGFKITNLAESVQIG